ncbi:MAG TPA: PDZ domain-containing protein [Kofleriaceae bacterium]|nr:PDZ domain-containing protein [Kofleriaceae bacterium]
MKRIARRSSGTVTAATAAMLMLAACAPGDAGQVGRDEAPVTDGDLARLPAPEPGAQPSDYRAVAPALRLLGVQRGDRPFATIMDTTTWQARNVALGEPISRNLSLTDMGDGWAEITDSSGGVQRMAVGGELSPRQIRHKFDDAATYAGKGVWNVVAENLAAARVEYGIGATAVERDDLFEGAPCIQLTAVDRGGVFDRLGFRRGDLLFEIDGQRVLPGDLERAADRFTSAREMPVTVRMLRGGSANALAYHIY